MIQKQYFIRRRLSLSPVVCTHMAHMAQMAYNKAQIKKSVEKIHQTDGKR